MRDYFIWLFKLLTLIVMFVVVIPLLLATFLMHGKDGAEALSGGSNKTVAVVELTGMIEDSKDVVAELYRQSVNEKVKGIVFAINSPGGAVGPSQDIYNAVKRLKSRKPIVVAMGAVAASGGLYSAVAASKIFAEPGTLTGSIGVILQIPNLTKISEKVGFDMVTVKSGKLKDVGNTFRPMTDDERQFLETTVAEAHRDFIDAVASGRNIPREKVVQFADGRVLLGSQAKALNVIDDFGDVHAAARAVFEILNTPLKENEDPVLYYPNDKFRELRRVLEGAVGWLPRITQPHWELRFVM